MECLSYTDFFLRNIVIQFSKFFYRIMMKNSKKHLKYNLQFNSHQVHESTSYKKKNEKIVSFVNLGNV